MKRISLVTAVFLLFVLALPIVVYASLDPVPCGTGCRYDFSLSGKIQGINPASPLAQFNGGTYTVTGFFTNTGALDITQLRVVADPASCSGGGCVADVNPRG